MDSLKEWSRWRGSGCGRRTVGAPARRLSAVEFASRGELMKTTANIRFASLAGLFLLSLVALALAAGATPAINAVGAGVGGGAATVGAYVPPAELAAALVRHNQLDRVAALAAPAATTQTAASSGLSTTTWVIIAVVVAMLAIAAWLLLRQRSRPGSATSRSAAFCSLHPDDSRCVAG
jgi:hypothetical protein